MSKPVKEKENLIEGLENKNFWYGERILFSISFLIFFLSAILLFLTESTNLTKFNSFIDYLFNSISVGTLTGLFRGDSGTYTFLGQLVLFINMFISGIVVSIVSILLIIFIRFGFDKKQNLKNELIKIGSHSKNIIIFTFFDLILLILMGTFLFYIFGSNSLWEAIFNSTSHILNDGITQLPNGMTIYKNNYGILLSGTTLITIGGLGIGIRGALYRYILIKLNLINIANFIPKDIILSKKYIYIVVIVTIILQLIGFLGFFYFESNNPSTLGNTTDTVYQTVNSYYMSVSSRTAGFSTLDNFANIKDRTSLLLIGLMSIGASSGSFAGGILKITSLYYLLLYMYSRLRGEKEVKTKKGFIWFSEKTIIESNFRIICFSFIVLLCFFMILDSQQNIPMLNLLFETISAVTNTGLTLNTTGLLSGISLYIIMSLMIIGKVGFLSVIISFFPNFQNLLNNADQGKDVFPVD